MKALFEVVILPVSDPDRSLRFYRDQVGFDLDVDYAPTPEFRVIQLTPEGASTSIQFGVGLTDAPVGSVRGLYLVVPDIEASRRELTIEGWTSARSGTRTPVVAGGRARTLLVWIRTGRITPPSPTSAIPTAMPGFFKSAVTAEPMISR